MRNRLFASIGVAVLLIGGAFWLRFAGQRTGGANLSLTDSPAGLNSYTPTNVDSVLAADDSVNKTSLMGQQLFTDFINMSISGDNSGGNINNLTDQYISNIPSLIKPQSITSQALNVVGNSSAEISSYSDSLHTILNKYDTDLKNAAPDSKKMDATFYAGARSMSNVYASTASQLKNIPVPGGISDAHVKLVNIYLSDAASMSAIANTETDPAKAMAGLINLQNNLDAEGVVLTQINSFLNKK